MKRGIENEKKYNIKYNNINLDPSGSCSSWSGMFIDFLVSA